MLKSNGTMFKDMFKKENLGENITILITALAMCFLFLHWLDAKGQSVVRKGNTFIQQNAKRSIPKDVPTLTQYTYEIDGVKYPVYKSKNGKYFIIRTSKNGKQYKMYVTKWIK